jgi:hypothetical protein
MPVLVSSYLLNQATARIAGKLGSSVEKALVIQVDFEPPLSVEPVSAIIIGLPGASPRISL